MVNRLGAVYAGLPMLLALHIDASAALSQGTTTLARPTSLSPTVSLAGLTHRRAAGLAQFRHGIVLLHSAPGFKRWEYSGCRQDASFYYFTGMANLHDAILAVDGPRHETILFVHVYTPL